MIIFIAIIIGDIDATELPRPAWRFLSGRHDSRFNQWQQGKTNGYGNQSQRPVADCPLSLSLTPNAPEETQSMRHATPPDSRSDPSTRHPPSYALIPTMVSRYKQPCVRRAESAQPRRVH
ncbi:unnamed protein product [Boreogadus saida]